MLDWTPPPPVAAARLEGRYVGLEPLRSDHAEALHEAVAGDDVDWTYLPVERPADADGTRRLVEQQLADPRMSTVVVRPAGDAVAGRLSWIRVEPVDGCAEVAWVLLGPRLRRTRAATEAVHLMLRQAFELGYRRVEWKCDALNAPSVRAARRLGFTHEGVFRQHKVVKGRNRDTAWFAITDADWPGVRDRHEAWLDPANFDAAGHQHHPLR